MKVKLKEHICNEIEKANGWVSFCNKNGNPIFYNKSFLDTLEVKKHKNKIMYVIIHPENINAYVVYIEHTYIIDEKDKNNP